MKLGMNLLLWTDDPTHEQWLPLCERLAALGYDGVELPIFDPRPEAYEKLGRQLEDMGLERTGVAICRPAADPISADTGVRGEALATLQRTIDCCEAAGCRLLGGPLYAAIGEFSGAGPTPDEWQHGVEVLRGAADHAARVEVTLALEFLNRFEIYLLNTAADTDRFARDVDRPNLGVHYDTFHAHIEEKDVGAALEACADRLVHVHVSENDRGTPGHGQVAWGETFEALARVGYDGWLTVEAFGRALPELAAATRIWRPLFDTPEQLAADALGFMQHAVEAHGLRS